MKICTHCNLEINDPAQIIAKIRPVLKDGVATTEKDIKFFHYVWKLEDGLHKTGYRWNMEKDECGPLKEADYEKNIQEINGEAK